MKPTILTVLLLACMSLCACSSTQANLPKVDRVPSQAGESPEQIQELADGKVSYDEYHAAYSRYVACMEKAGYTVTTLPPQYDVITFTVPGAAVDSGVDNRCYEREFDQVDTVWEGAHQNTSYTAHVFRACLTRHHIVPSQTLVGMSKQLDALHEDPLKWCAVELAAPSTAP
jgi:hypothetical protein